MDTERHVEIDETHETPEAPEAPESVEQVEAAAAAVALAGATAAAAELDAAERMRRFEAESQEWRNSLQENVSQLSSSLQALREAELSEMRAGQTALSETVAALALWREEQESRRSIPPPSMPEPVTETLAGGEAAIAAGPLEVNAGASLAGSEGEQQTSPSAHPVRRRRWI